jgi:hypothetical protein
MAQIFNIVNDTVVISKLTYAQSEGNSKHIGTFRITGDATLDTNLNVAGTLTVNTLHVKNLVTEEGPRSDVGNWTGQVESDINGRGLQWSTGNSITQLSYLSGRIWSNSDLDLELGKSYKIDNVEVISAGSLGPTVTKSNIRELGALKSLNVVGDSVFGEFAYFKSGFGRLGLGTDQPNSSISIVESEVEIAIGSQKLGTAEIGTYSNSNLELITDNTARITVKGNGEVVIGDEQSKNGVLRVYGSIHTENIVSDIRIERTSSLEFRPTRDTSSFGKGLVWHDGELRRQLIMLAAPERLWSSESLELAESKSFVINGSEVLGQTFLGSSVVNSSLTRVGDLESLTVQGVATFNGDVNVNQVSVQHLSVANSITANGISSNGNLVLTVNDKEALYADDNEIAIGNKTNTRRPVKVYGPVSIGITNPDDTVDLAVKGDISFANKKFLTGSGAPVSGTFNRGDIVWNTHPIENSYIGWVCVVEGTPGEWLPFGAIGRK